MSIATSKKSAYDAAAKYGCTIDYERGAGRIPYFELL